ncbi:hypothetical protein JZ751_020104, partial [Albula glossodonta]
MVRKQVTQTADVLPPWKQGGYTEASLTRMTGGITHVQTSTQISMEQRWEGAYGMQQQAAGAVGVAVKEGKGGKKKEAVATVLAAVDQARVRKPVHEEGGHAEEGVIEYGLAQQFVTVQAAEEGVVTKKLKTEAVQITPPVQIPSPEKSVHFA